MQIKGPTSKQWIALAQGSRMPGANMFVIYVDSSGSNVTLSPRRTNSHREPQFTRDAAVSLLEGSGIEGDMMTANIRCKLRDSTAHLKWSP